MKAIQITNARKNIYKLIDNVISSSEPVTITTKNGDAVLISKNDWDSIQETLYLLSIPGMREKIVEGMKTSVDECHDVEELGWSID